jgi:hypothetical protein
MRSVKWLCPARENDEPCLEPLPCAEHNISDADIGAALWGNFYAAI